MNVRINHHDICAFGISFGILTPDAIAKIVFWKHFFFFIFFLHISFFLFLLLDER